jgi:hypothetical protein
MKFVLADLIKRSIRDVFCVARPLNRVSFIDLRKVRKFEKKTKFKTSFFRNNRDIT